MPETVSTSFLPYEIRIKAEKYVWKHYPFSGWHCEQEIAYTFTQTNHTTRHNGEGKWFVRVTLPRLQAAYGLFIYVSEDGEVGGFLEDDREQKMFTFVPPESSPVVTNWPTKSLDAEEEAIK